MGVFWRIRGRDAFTTLSRDGRYLAYQFTSPREPGDAWVYDTETGETTRLTRSADEELIASLREPELHRFEAFDGESVPVFLFLPERSDPAPLLDFPATGRSASRSRRAR